MTTNHQVTCTTTCQKVNKHTSHSSKCEVVKLKMLPDSMYKIISLWNWSSWSNANRRMKHSCSACKDWVYQNAGTEQDKCKL